MNLTTDPWRTGVLAEGAGPDRVPRAQSAPPPGPVTQGRERVPTATLGTFLGTVSRRWRVVLLVTLACLGLAAAAGMTIAPTYTASTSLVVSPTAADPFGSAGEEVNIRTEREILASSEVARLAADTLGVDFSPQSFLLTARDVAAPSGSQVLIVSVSASSPETAAEAADALASAYLEFRSSGAVEAAERYIAAIDERLAESTADDGTLTESLLEQRHRLALVGSDPGRIIGAASVPSAPSSPGMTMFLAAGLVGGLVLGSSGALLRERLDGRVRRADRLSAATGTEVITSQGSTADEAWRQVAFLLRHDARGGTLVCLAGAQDDGGAAVAALEKALRATGVAVRVAPRPEPVSAAVDDGWPVVTDDSPSDIVLADLSGLSSVARLALVLERAHAVVLLTTPRTSLAHARHVVSARDLAGTDALVPVLITRDRTGKHGERRTE